MKKYIYITFVVILLLLGAYIGYRLAGGRVLAGILTFIGGATAAYKKKSEKLSDEADETEKEGEEIVEEAEQTMEEGEGREDEAEEISDNIQDLKDRDEERYENFNDNFKNFVIVLLLLPGLLFILSGPALADEANIMELTPEELVQDQDLTAEDFRIPDDYDRLLEQHTRVLKLMFGFRNLSQVEREEKLEAIEEAERAEKLAEQERKDKEEIYNYLKEMEKKLDRMAEIQKAQDEIIEELVNQQSGPFGLFLGGSTDKELEAGLTIDF